MSQPNNPYQPRQSLPALSPNASYPPQYGSASPYHPNMPPHQLSHNLQQYPPVQYSTNSPTDPNSHLHAPHLNSISAPRLSPPAEGRPAPAPARPVNGVHAPVPGSMGPPSKPAGRESDLMAGSKGTTDINKLDDPLAQAGINLEEEERNLTSSNFYTRQYESGGGIATQSATGGLTGAGFAGTGSRDVRANGLSEQEQQAQQQREDNYQAGRWAENALWDSFLHGGTLEKRFLELGKVNTIPTPRNGIYYPQADTRPQKTGVRGDNGAIQIIDQGQTIIDPAPGTGRLIADILKTVSLAARERLVGIIDHSSRLANERRETSTGMVPDEWKPVALLPPAPTTSKPTAGSTATKSVKRTFDQMNEEPAKPGPSPLVTMLQKVAEKNQVAEQARLAKRLRREKGQSDNAATPGTPGADSNAPGGVSTSATGAPVEPPKRMAKKERKAMEKLADTPQQRDESNRAARMALLSAKGKFAKKYDWLTNTGAAPSPAARLNKPGTSNPPSGSGTPGAVRSGAVTPTTKRFGEWSEQEDQGMHARDVIAAIEGDTTCIRAFSRACNVVEKTERK